MYTLEYCRISCSKNAPAPCRSLKHVLKMSELKSKAHVAKMNSNILSSEFLEKGRGKRSGFPLKIGGKSSGGTRLRDWNLRFAKRP